MTEQVYSRLKQMDVWRRRLPARIWNRLRYPADLAQVLALDSPRHPGELIALYELARAAPPDGSIVEIGSFRGSSAVALGLGGRDLLDSARFRRHSIHGKITVLRPAPAS